MQSTYAEEPNTQFALSAISTTHGTLVDAQDRLAGARAEYQSALEEIDASKKIMHAIQAEAEAMQLAALEASSEVSDIKDAYKKFAANEEIKLDAYKTALDILREAQQMVDQTKLELEEAQQTRVAYEIENAAVFINEAKIQIKYRKLLSSAQLATAESRLTLASAERRLVQSEIDIAGVHLDLLDSAEALEIWPQMREAITFTGGNF